ncbi:xylan 1,4-beta-xylosidase [Streptomyces sp. CA-294286]|uniref:xylan 1,4-beta-xylosidase n=1 Tax=Streptomyces sp. CA-294286 TaxID=3240070 RepID=UPI003D9442AA
MGRHGWNPGARRWRFAALLGVGMTALALVLTMCSVWPGDDGAAVPGTTTDGARPHGIPPSVSGAPKPELGWGFTHTQYSADDDTPVPAARARAESLLADRGLPQVQHLMGWGSDNPEPSPGRYRFDAMDSRIDLVRASGGTPVVTLCCAPDWMKGGKPGAKTDWSPQALETAPRPEHYADFAKLAGVVARRYPDVKHFIVWNEFKGFFDDRAKRWNYEGYTELYNLVHAELKKVDADILVGGPYLVMDSHEPRATEYASHVKGPWGSIDQRSLDAFTYWNEHKAGADFVVVDGSSYTRDDELLPDEFRATDKFTAVSRWVREQTANELPLWWAEYYVEPGDSNDARDDWSEPRRAAVHATGMIALARGGTGTAFYWNPQNQGARCAGCLWKSTQLADGGRELPMMALLSRFAKEFPPGVRRDDTVAVAAAGAPHVRVLANDRTALVVNTLARRVETEVDGQEVDLGPYEVRWLTRR